MPCKPGICRGFATKMVYLYYITCLRYTILVANPRYGSFEQKMFLVCCKMKFTTMMDFICIHMIIHMDTYKIHHCDVCGWVCWQILEELLNVEKCPRKPQYSMASGNGKPFFGLACFLFVINILRTALERLLWDGVDHAWHPSPPPPKVL